MEITKRLFITTIVGVTVIGAAWHSSGVNAATREPGGETELRAAATFADIADERQRSVALFSEAARVLTHARCINCHPAGQSPLQGEEGSRHEPPVTRGAVNFGVAGMRCPACHLDANFDPGNVPGAPHWRLAPIEMTWQGLSHRELCEQLKDRKRNGDRDLLAIVGHMSDDPLVAWAWAPGGGRAPAPGSQKVFGELIGAWAESGAACPE